MSGEAEASLQLLEALVGALAGPPGVRPPTEQAVEQLTAVIKVYSDSRWGAACSDDPVVHRMAMSLATSSLPGILLENFDWSACGWGTPAGLPYELAEALLCAHLALTRGLLSSRLPEGKRVQLLSAVVPLVDALLRTEHPVPSLAQISEGFGFLFYDPCRRAIEDEQLLRQLRERPALRDFLVDSLARVLLNVREDTSFETPAGPPNMLMANRSSWLALRGVALQALGFVIRLERFGRDPVRQVILPAYLDSLHAELAFLRANAEAVTVQDLGLLLPDLGILARLTVNLSWLYAEAKSPTAATATELNVRRYNLVCSLLQAQLAIFNAFEAVGGIKEPLGGAPSSERDAFGRELSAAARAVAEQALCPQLYSPAYTNLMLPILIPTLCALVELYHVGLGPDPAPLSLYFQGNLVRSAFGLERLKKGCVWLRRLLGRPCQQAQRSGGPARAERRRQPLPAPVPAVVDEQERRRQEAAATEAAEALLREEEAASQAAMARAAKNRAKRERQKQQRKEQAQEAQQTQQAPPTLPAHDTEEQPTAEPAHDTEEQPPVCTAKQASSNAAVASAEPPASRPVQLPPTPQPQQLQSAPAVETTSLAGEEEAELLQLLAQLGVGAESAAAAGEQPPGEVTPEREQGVPTRTAALDTAGAAPTTPQSAPRPKAGPNAPAAAAIAAAAGGGSQGEEDASCILCMEGPRESVLVPCGHQALCLPCTQQLFQRAEAAGGGGAVLCPYCRQQVAQFVKVFHV